VIPVLSFFPALLHIIGMKPVNPQYAVTGTLCVITIRIISGGYQKDKKS
jgi:hypothetical protein